MKAVDAYGQLLVDLLNAPADTPSYHCTRLGVSTPKCAQMVAARGQMRWMSSDMIR